MATDSVLRVQSNDLWNEYFKVDTPIKPDSLDMSLLGAFIGLFGATILFWAAAGSPRFRHFLRGISLSPEFAGDINSRAQHVRRISQASHGQAAVVESDVSHSNGAALP
jgi:hypothetical protein